MGVRYNTKVDLGEIGWGRMDWIHLAQDRDEWIAPVNIIMNFPVPYNVGKYFSGSTAGSFSRRAQPHEVSILFIYIVFHK
jgi:hypothetical protein